MRLTGLITRLRVSIPSRLESASRELAYYFFVKKYNSSLEIVLKCLSVRLSETVL